jgi:hypothetical protein
MATVYNDTPLHLDASTNIRLLRILPTDNDDTKIACNLHVVALQDSPVYTALSYVWVRQHLHERSLSMESPLPYAKTSGTFFIKHDKTEKVVRFG